jgi:hypothetical protein
MKFSTSTGYNAPKKMNQITNNTTTSYRHNEALCKIPSASPRLRGKNKYGPLASLTTRLKRINSPKKQMPLCESKTASHETRPSPPIGVKPDKGYSSLVKDILIEGGAQIKTPVLNNLIKIICEIPNNKLAFCLSQA